MVQYIYTYMYTHVCVCVCVSNNPLESQLNWQARNCVKSFWPRVDSSILVLSQLLGPVNHQNIQIILLPNC